MCVYVCLSSLQKGAIVRVIHLSPSIRGQERRHGARGRGAVLGKGKEIKINAFFHIGCLFSLLSCITKTVESEFLEKTIPGNILSMIMLIYFH